MSEQKSEVKLKQPECVCRDVPIRFFFFYPDPNQSPLILISADTEPRSNI